MIIVPYVEGENTWSVYVDGTLRTTLPEVHSRDKAIQIARQLYPQADSLWVIDYRKPA